MAAITSKNLTQAHIAVNQTAKKSAAARPVAKVTSKALGSQFFAQRSQAALSASQKTAYRSARRAVIRAAQISDETNEEWNKVAKAERLAHLEAQAMESLRKAGEEFENTTFPCALIAGDVVILHLLHKLDMLKNGKVKIMYVDTFHLFPETNQFLAKKEGEYGFKAEQFKAEGCDTKEEYDAKYGADLWKENIEEYDRVCKVEPFGRGLKTLETQAMVNGRRRDHGAERAFIPVYEATGGMAKINPLAYWTFEDCFDYLNANNVSYHPLHDEGYPSIGDAKDTVPVPKEKWFDYAGERAGRFVGLQNADGSKKTECGIHVEGAEKTFDRDLWEADKSAVAEVSDADLSGSNAEDMLVTVYAPWCQFCQAMEGGFEEFAASGAVKAGKYRGDEQRAFIQTLGVESFPTILYVPKGGKPVKYTGSEDERDAASLAKFVESQKVAA